MQVGAALDFGLSEPFAEDKVSQQLEQVAKLITVSDVFPGYHPYLVSKSSYVFPGYHP